MSPFLAEFIGTMLLIIFGSGVVAGVLLKKTKSENAGWLVIAIGWGLSVTIGIYTVGAYSGAHLNPAVTLGLAIVGDFPWEKVPLYIISQLAGAFTGAVVVWLHYLPHWRVTKEPETQLAVFSTGPAIHHPWPNLLSEMIGTFILMFGLLSIGSNRFTDGLNPLVIGGLILAIGLSLGATTGYAINPARDLGPRIAHFLLPIAGKGSSDWNYSWVPVLGPLLGGTLGALVFKALFKGEINFMLWPVLALTGLIIVMAIIKESKPVNHS